MSIQARMTILLFLETCDHDTCAVGSVFPSPKEMAAILLPAMPGNPEAKTS